MSDLVPDRCRISWTLDFETDVSIRHRDVLDYAKQRNLVSHIESWMTYIIPGITRSSNLIARPEIKSTSIVRKGWMTAHAMPITVCL
jgi:hypothetical protein